MEQPPVTRFDFQRRFRRAPVLCTLRVSQGNVTKQWLATSINEGGFLLLSDTPVEIGTGFSLSLELPNLTLIRAVAEPCSAIPLIGAGVKFTNISPNYCQHIAAAVKSALSKETIERNSPPNSDQMRMPEGISVEPRICVLCEVQLEGEGFIQRGRMHDVSRHGLSILVTKPRPIGQEIRITDLRKRFETVAVVRNCLSLAGQWRLGMQLSSALSGSDKWIFR